MKRTHLHLMIAATARALVPKQAQWFWTSASVVVLSVLIAGTAAASDFNRPAMSVSGFGTLGAVYHDSEGLEFRRSIAQPRGARAGELELATDSLLGLQLNARLGSQLELMVQGTSRLSAHGDWRPEVTRALARLAPNDSWMLRVGRFGLGIFLQADALDVGYSFIPIRPPPEAYGIAAMDHVDGADVTLTGELAGGVGRVRFLHGRLAGHLALSDGSAADLEIDSIWGGYAEYLYGRWQLRVSGIRVHTSVPVTPPALTDALRATGVPQSMALADELSYGAGSTDLLQLGVAYDHAPVLGQVTVLHLNSEVAGGPRINAGFALLAHRHRQLTNYMMFAVADSFADIRSTGLPDTPQLAPLNAGAYAVQTVAQVTQRTISVGARYDIGTHVDVKLQVDHAWLGQPSLAFDRNTTPRQRAEMTVFGVALDFVF